MASEITTFLSRDSVFPHQRRPLKRGGAKRQDPGGGSRSALVTGSGGEPEKWLKIWEFRFPATVFEEDYSQLKRALGGELSIDHKAGGWAGLDPAGTHSNL